MSSGYFPVHPKDQWGVDLARAASAVRGVIDAWYESRGVLNAEDAAQDQSYVDALVVAEANIKDCLRVDESDLAAVNEQMRLAEERREFAERQVDHWSAIAARIKATNLLDRACERAVTP